LNIFLNKRAESHGVTLAFNTTVENVSIDNDEGVVVRCSNGKKYRSDVVLVATGSGDLSQINTDEKNTHKKTFWIQSSIGFQHPDLFFGATARYEGDPDRIQQNIPHQYYYHYNRKVNPFGPLYTIRWDNHFDIGILHQSYEIAVNKLVAVIQKYKRIQPYFNNVKPMDFPWASKVDGIPIMKVGISKHPVKKKSKNRALLLGEAAGLVSELFYEGVCGGIVSAKIASDILKPLKENSNAQLGESEKYSDKIEHLGKYDTILDNTLVNTYLKSSHGSETLFLNSGDPGEVIFDCYCDLLSKNKQLRKCVYDAMVLSDLSQYNFDNDRITGEEILKALPLAQKVLFTPIFLKAMMT
jgi:flavin-dependent dehydrogenase